MTSAEFGPPAATAQCETTPDLLTADTRRPAKVILILTNLIKILTLMIIAGLDRKPLQAKTRIARTNETNSYSDHSDKWKAPMKGKIRAILYGIGPLGKKVGKFILENGYIDVVGAIDLTNVGRDLGDVIGAGRKIGVTITDDAEGLLARVDADIVVHMTASSLEKVMPQLVQCARAGLDVITSCEELSYPYLKYRETADRLHKMFKRNGVSVLGTGINPGFLMDKFPLLISGICQTVTRVRVTRMMYSRTRRPSFQKKIGTGMDKKEFLRLIEEKVITGHVGLVESAAMIVDGLGWEVDEILELPVEPVICESEVTTYTDSSKKEALMTVKPGQVAGLRSVAEARKNGKALVTLDFVAHANVEEPYDSVELEGTPNLHVKFVGGMDGDIGTVAILVNSVPSVLNAAPGVLTMKDLNMPVPLTDNVVHDRRMKRSAARSSAVGS